MHNQLWENNMKKKLFENVGGNQFKLVKENFNTENPEGESSDDQYFSTEHEPERSERVDINSLPVTIDDLMSTKAKFLGHPRTGGSVEIAKNPLPPYILQYKNSSKIVAARKIFGYDYDFSKLPDPNGFHYDISVAYSREDGSRGTLSFAVSSDGQHIEYYVLEYK